MLGSLMVVHDDPYLEAVAYSFNIHLKTHGPLKIIFEDMGVLYSPENVTYVIGKFLKIDIPNVLFVDPFCTESGDNQLKSLLNTNRHDIDALLMQQKDVGLQLFTLLPRKVTRYTEFKEGGMYDQFLMDKSGNHGKQFALKDIDWLAMKKASFEKFTQNDAYQRFEAIREQLVSDPNELPEQLRSGSAFKTYHELLGSLPWAVIINGQYHEVTEFIHEDNWSIKERPLPLYAMDLWDDFIQRLLKDVDPKTLVTMYETQ